GKIALNVGGAIYGAFAGGVGGYISSGGSLLGTIAGAGAGALVGSVNPWASNAVGAAAGSAVGSLLGQAAGNFVSGKDPFAKCNYDYYAIAGAAAGGFFAGPLNYQFSRNIIPFFINPQTASQLATTRIVANLSGAAVEGGFVALTEVTGSVIGSEISD
ncbi:MAG: hypothetical protein ACJAYS_000456, partial [Lentimonas sp.]